MYPVSARFLATLVESHTPVCEVALFLTDGRVEPLSVVDGSVSVDRSQQCRRTCTVTVADPALIPRTPADKLSVYGARLRIARGVQAGEYQELVPVGVFRIDSVEGDVDEGPVTIQGKSLECVIADDKFTAPWRSAGTAVGAITALIQRSIPDAAVTTAATVVDAPIGTRTFDVEGDPWEAVRELAAAIGAEVYCDADGTFVISDLPDLLTTPPAWTVSVGDGGAYISAARGMNSDGVHNGVLARGENTESNTAPVSSLVVDGDPGSPTYWDGPFGRRPMFYSSSTLITTAQCTAAATLKLRAAQAPNATASLTALANPALEPGDVLRVVYMDGSAELHQVHSFPVDLVGGDMAIQTISAKEGT
ncbi:DUF5047 domain-containing protein [Streptomyces sp. NPDC017936]|uniref:DUF5047 domain-containing protein n=1 Tax=Streptomyces sp. NPDC017936 TaxID=3365016 RepID=UPI0037BD4AFA